MSVVPSPAIGDVVDQVSSWTPGRDDPDGEFAYVDLSAVDQNSKRIASPRRLASKDAPSRARQVIRSGDVLVSTVRPNLNAVGRVPVELDGATASTGFCVLRPRSEVADGAYLFHWVRSPGFVSEMVRRATGASYPAVSDRIVCESKIPLPSLPEQRRIAEILDKADALRAKRRAALAHLDTLTQSIFRDMFGDPVASGWRMTTIDGIAAETDGAIRTGPFGSQLLHSEFTEEGIAVLGIDNAVENEFRWSQGRFISEAKYRQLSRYTVHAGDVLITIMGTCGRCAIVPDDIPRAVNTKHLCCITLDRTKCLPVFLHAYFLQHPIARRYLARKAKGAIMAGLNMGIIRDMPVPLAPIDLQEEFAEIVKAVGSVRRVQRQAEDEVETLLASLQQRAFRGEL